MRIANERRRVGLVGLAMLVCLLLPAVASAQGTPAGKAGATQDIVEAVDVGAGTVVLGAETFAVKGAGPTWTSQTMWEWTSGATTKFTRRAA